MTERIKDNLISFLIGMIAPIIVQALVFAVELIINHLKP